MKCPNCGADLKENSKFCSKCGNKIEIKTVNKNSSSNSLPILLALIVVVFLLVVGFYVAGGFIGNGNLVDVTSISMDVGYYDTPFGGALSSLAYENGEDVDYRDYQVLEAVTEFTLMPREDITRITSLAIENVEVTFQDGESENWGSFIYTPDEYYLQDVGYDFKFTKTLDDNGKSIEEYYLITHIKGDIVINTTDEVNKVIGHLDEDITPNHY